MESRQYSSIDLFYDIKDDICVSAPREGAVKVSFFYFDSRRGMARVTRRESGHGSGPYGP